MIITDQGALLSDTIPTGSPENNTAQVKSTNLIVTSQPFFGMITSVTREHFAAQPQGIYSVAAGNLGHLPAAETLSTRLWLCPFNCNLIFNGYKNINETGVITNEAA